MKMKELVDLPEKLSWSHINSLPASNDTPTVCSPDVRKVACSKKLVSVINSDYKDPD